MRLVSIAALGQALSGLGTGRSPSSSGCSPSAQALLSRPQSTLSFEPIMHFLTRPSCRGPLVKFRRRFSGCPVPGTWPSLAPPPSPSRFPPFEISLAVRCPLSITTICPPIHTYSNPTFSLSLFTPSCAVPLLLSPCLHPSSPPRANGSKSVSSQRVRERCLRSIYPLVISLFSQLNISRVNLWEASWRSWNPRYQPHIQIDDDLSYHPSYSRYVTV